MHVHLLVTSTGVSEVRYSADDYTRLWLHKQRLIDSEIRVTYAGYVPHIAADAIQIASESVARPIVAYVGYAFEDRSQCAACEL